MFKRFENHDAMQRLSNDLKLEQPTALTQDWAYEVADRHRLREFIDSYDTNAYGYNEKYSLMQIILQSMNDVVEFGESFDEEIWRRVETILIRDKDIHAHTIHYWSLWDQDDGGLGEESWFAITRRMRNVWNACGLVRLSRDDL